MVSNAKGKKYGRELVRAVSDPLDGKLISDTITANGPNQWKALSDTSRCIESVLIKALAANSGTVYVTGDEGNTDGYPLAAGETVSINTDNLTKVQIYVATSGDGFAYLAIEAARD